MLSMKSVIRLYGRSDARHESTSLRHLAFVSVLLAALRSRSMPASGAGVIEVCETGFFLYFVQ